VVDGPEILDRRMYGHRPEVAEVVQENDVDGSFVETPVGIPADLLAMVHETPSVDPEPVQETVSAETEKVHEENPNSRFRLLDVAIKKPGTCLVCKSDGSDERQFVDFGKTVDWYGVVYVCTFCLGEVAKLLGLQNVSSLAAELARYEKAVQDFGTQNAELSEQLNAARLLLRNCHCGDGNSGDSVSDPVSLDEKFDSIPEQSAFDLDESGDVEESGDVSESPVDDDENTGPAKPKRTRRTNSSS
jgi:hypothetical protein